MECMLMRIVRKYNSLSSMWPAASCIAAETASSRVDGRAAVHAQLEKGDVAGTVGQQEDHGVGDIVWSGELLQRDAEPEFDRCDGGFDVRCAAQRHRQCARFGAVVAQRTGDGFQRLRALVEQRAAGAVGGETSRDRRADAAHGAGHDHDA